MGFNEKEYLKLRQQRTEKADGTTPSAGANTAGQSAFEREYLKLREQRQSQKQTEVSQVRAHKPAAVPENYTDFLDFSDATDIQDVKNRMYLNSPITKLGQNRMGELTGGSQFVEGLNQGAEERYSSVKALEPLYGEKKYAVETAQSSMETAKQNLEKWGNHVVFIKNSYDQNPTAENEALFNRAYAEYERLREIYDTEYETYSAAYDDFKPVAEEYEAATAAYQKYMQDLPGLMRDLQPVSLITKEGTRVKQLQDALEQNQQNAADDASLMEKDIAIYDSWPEEDKNLLQEYILDRPSGFNDLAGILQRSAIGADTPFDKNLQATLALQKLSQKYGAQTVLNLAESVQRYENAQMAEKAKQAGQDGAKTTGGKIGHSALSVAANTVGSMTSPISVLSNLATNTGRYSSMDPNGVGQLAGQYAASVRKTVTDAMEADGSAWGKAGSTLYSAGMSALDSLARGLASGGGSYLAGLGSFGQSVSQWSEKGASPVQALAMGIVDGGLEMLTEKYSLDNLFNMAKVAPKSFREVLKRVAVQGGIEVSEEMANLIGSTLAEAAIMKEDSSFNQTIAKRTATGESYEEAKYHASMDLVTEAAETVVQSFLSGGMMTGVTQVGSAAKSKYISKKYDFTSMSAEDVNEYIGEALQLDPESEAYKVAYELRQKGKNGQKISAYDIGRLYQANLIEEQKAAEKVDKDTLLPIEDGTEQAESQTVENIGREQMNEGVLQRNNLAENVINNTESVTNKVIPSQKETTGSMQLTSVDPTASIAEQLRQQQLIAQNESTQMVSEGLQLPALDNDGGMNYEYQQFGYATQPRTGIPDGSQERNAYPGAGEQTGQLAESTEKRRSGQTPEQVRASIDRRNRAQNLRRQGLIQKTNTLALGIESGTEDNTILEYPQEYWDSEMTSLAERIYNETGKNIRYVVGKMMVSGENGKKIKVRGYYGGENIIVQVDNAAATMEQIADHETYHAKADIYRMSGLNKTIRQHIVNNFSREEYEAVLGVYVQQLRGIYNADEILSGDDYEQIVADVEEELLADAYAGINAFGTGADKFTEAVNKKMDEQYIGKQRQENGTAQITGPPSGEIRENQEHFSYAGENAYGADLNALAEAKELETQDVSSETIRQQTGWFKGTDGKWRWEIDDSQMKYFRGGDALFTQDHPEYGRHQELTQKMLTGDISQEEITELQQLNEIWGREYGRLSARVNSGTARLENMIQHDKLFQAYPKLRDTRVIFSNIGGNRGSYDSERNVITIDSSLRNAPEKTLLHEIQHAIQNIEGFPSGSSIDYWNEQLAGGANVQTKGLQDAADKLWEFVNRPQNVTVMEYVRRLERAALQDDNFAAYDAVMEEADRAGLAGLIDEYYSLRDEYYWQKGSAEQMDANDLYRNTAGEIESRDTAQRRNLDEEGRKKTPPDMGSERNVYIGRGNTENLDIAKTVDNKPFVIVTENILDGVKESDWISTIKKNLKNKFPNGITVGKNNILIDRQSRKEMTFSKYMQHLYKKDKALWEQKLMSTNNADEIVLATTDWVNEGLKHSRKDDIVDFARGKVLLRIGNADYSADVVVGTRRNGEMLLYDIVGLTPTIITQKATDTAYNDNPSKENARQAVSVDDYNLPQRRESVNENFDEQLGLRLRSMDEENSTVPTAKERFSVDDNSRTNAEGKQQFTTQYDVANKAMRKTLMQQFHIPQEQEEQLRLVIDSFTKEANRKIPERPRAAKTDKPVRKSSPIEAKRDLRNTLNNLFSIQEGNRAEVGAVIDGFAERMLKNKALTEEDRRIFFEKMYDAGVMTVPAEGIYAEGRNYLKDAHIYVPDQVIMELGDEWSDIRRRAFSAGVYLTRQRMTNNRNNSGIDVWNEELSYLLPGLFYSEDTDMTSILERIVSVAEEGKDEKLSLADYTARLASIEHQSEEEFLDNMERQMDWALRTFAEKAQLEIKLRDRTGKKLAQERENRKEAAHLQKDRRELQELQQKTLKQLQWLKKNQFRAPEELRETWNEVLSDIDLYAVGAANEMNWSDKYGATWKDLAAMYDKAKAEDPNFFELKELEKIVGRLRYAKLEDMDLNDLNALYRMAVGLRTAYYNKKNLINDEMHRMFAEVSHDSKNEIEAAPGKYTGKTMDKLFNQEQLTPMNVLQRMGGWDPDGTFYSMAKQLEHGERDMRAHSVKANKLLEEFLTENEAWVKRADGQGKDAIWYEIEVPELQELRMGDKPIFGDTVTVFMTPAQKVHMYLESKNQDNLRHMVGGRTFADKELYRNGKRQDAFAQGKIIRLAPETVKQIVSDLTEEEMALAKVLDSYYNSFATQEINRVSNVLYGYDKAMGKNYAPIYTNTNFTKQEFGVFEQTAESVSNLKERTHSQNPSLNISAFDAFEKSVEQTARFVGMAIPVRNLTTLLNYSGTDWSMRNVITKKWGVQADKYIENLVQALQGEEDRDTDTISTSLEKLKSKYITAIFGFNPSIVLKQLGSIPLASAYLGVNTTPSAKQVATIDRDLIGKYTQDLAWRTMGYSMPETKFLKDNPNWTQTNKFANFTFGGGAITAMDGWAASVLWPWAENKVRKDFPDIEVGTPAQVVNGDSPFYKKVAEEFENALARSQSVSDETHQGTLRKSKNPFTRAFTLFKSDSAQTYNTIRQKIGEAQYYARKGDRKALNAAKRAAGAAILSAITSFTYAEVIDFLMNLWKQKGKKYRDEEEELTVASIAGEMVSGLVGGMAGVVVGGEELAELIGNWITGDKWYGIETMGLEQLNDLIENLNSASKKMQKFVTGAADVVKNDGDLQKYLKKHSAEIISTIKDIAETAGTYFAGVPVSNLEAYLMGLVSWVSPEVYTAYEDISSAAKKSGLSNLEGDALNMRLEHILEDRSVSVSEKTVEQIVDLYNGGYTQTVPSSTPTSISVNGVDHQLSAYQQQTYDLIWGGTVTDGLDDLVSDPQFRTMTDKDKSKTIKKLYDYAADMAKAETFNEYQLDNTVEDNRAIIAAGASVAECILWNSVTTDMKAAEKAEELLIWDLPEKAKMTIFETKISESRAEAAQTIMKTGLSFNDFLEIYSKYGELSNTDLSASEKTIELSHWIDNQDYTDKQTAVIKEELAYFNMMPATASKYDGLVSAGMDEGDAYKLSGILGELQPEAGEDEVSNLQKWRASVDFSDDVEDQLTALSMVMTDPQLQKVELANSYGISPRTYVDIREAMVNCDADGNGSFTNSEVQAAIDSLSEATLTTEKKAVLWQLATGSKSAKNNPYSKDIGQQIIDARTVQTSAEDSAENTGSNSTSAMLTFEEAFARQMMGG